MSMTLNERNPNIAEIGIGTQAATITLTGIYFRKRARIKNIHYLDQAGIAADNTNFLQISVQDAAANVYATLDTRAAHDGANTAFVPQALEMPNPDLTIDAAATPVGQQETDVPAGTTLRVVITKNGTGVPTLGRLQIEYYSA